MPPDTGAREAKCLLELKKRLTEQFTRDNTFTVSYPLLVSELSIYTNLTVYKVKKLIQEFYLDTGDVELDRTAMVLKKKGDTL